MSSSSSTATSSNGKVVALSKSELMEALFSLKKVELDQGFIDMLPVSGMYFSDREHYFLSFISVWSQRAVIYYKRGSELLRYAVSREDALPLLAKFSAVSRGSAVTSKVSLDGIAQQHTSQSGRFSVYMAKTLGLPAVLPPMVNGKVQRVLTIDGGGTRGVVPIQMLRQIEIRTGKPIHELFDLIVGTSTGGILAAAIGLLHLSLDECEQLYLDMGEVVFDKALLSLTKHVVFDGARYDAERLTKLLKSVIQTKTGNSDILLTDPLFAKRTKVIIVAATGNWQLPEKILFTNYDDHGESKQLRPNKRDIPLWQVLRATSAAPTYFKAERIDHVDYVDGGLTANNPTEVAIDEMKDVFGIQTADEIRCIVSLGTGIAGWKTVEANVKGALIQIQQVATETERTDKRVASGPFASRYSRWQIHIGDISLDEVDKTKLANLMLKTKQEIVQMKKEVNAVKECLVGVEAEDDSKM